MGHPNRNGLDYLLLVLKIGNQLWFEHLFLGGVAETKLTFVVFALRVKEALSVEENGEVIGDGDLFDGISEPKKERF